MKGTSFFISLILYSLTSFSQSKEEQAKGQDCKTKWSYYQLKGTTKGVVLYHQNSLVSCGIISTASVTLIRTDSGNIIRVLELCNRQRFFQIGRKVSVVADGDKSSRGHYVPYDPQACTILKTCFGKISNY